MLVGVRDELFDAGEDVVHDDSLLEAPVQVLAKVFHFVGSRGANLSLAVFQKVLQREENWRSYDFPLPCPTDKNLKSKGDIQSLATIIFQKKI